MNFFKKRQFKGNVCDFENGCNPTIIIGDEERMNEQTKNYGENLING